MKGHDLIRVAITTVLALVTTPAAPGQEQDAAAPPAETDLTLDFMGQPAEADATLSAGKSGWDKFLENLRFNVDIIARGGYYTRRGEAQGLFAAGFDIYKVFSDNEGDIGTMLLQPYIVYRANPYGRMIRIDGDDSWIVELHQFYFDLTRFGRGRTDVKVGHFLVPFGLEPRIDTHFTLYQLMPVVTTGAKMDWGVELHGAFPEFDYGVSLTTGTGMDFTGYESGTTYLVSGRIGTPTEKNFVLGFSGLYGQIHDDHAIHRFDEGDPDERAEHAGFLRRWRAGVDFTQVVSQFTINGMMDVGQDFDSGSFDALVELNWYTADELFTAYIQGIYAGLDGFFGWDETIQSRLGCLWTISNNWKLSAQWVHDFETYAEYKGGSHLDEDLLRAQLRFTF